MADIFVSYARANRNVAERLAESLATSGWSVWWDPRLNAGEIWDEAIERELKAARAVVVLWSAASVKSRWVRKEARFGDTEKRLFPALIETAEIPFEFTDVHAEDLRDWTEDRSHPGLHKLRGALAGSLGEPSPRQSQPSGQPEPPPAIPEVTNGRATPKSEPSAMTNARGPAQDKQAILEPETVLIEPGSFVMGSKRPSLVSRMLGKNQTFVQREREHEQPAHTVTIGYHFEIGKYPITFVEYDAFCDGTGRNKPRDRGWGRGRRPVINVNLVDAHAYVDWLTKESGKTYRLPSEAEWEYCCRAGTRTQYWFGDDITEKDANFRENGLKNAGVGKTTEVGNYPPNPWGLHDMHGNVWEWVEDCWHDSYEGAPEDGQAWLNTNGGDCKRRVLRGGSWDASQERPRAAYRCHWYSRYDRRSFIGFRVVCSSPSSGH